MNDSRRRRGRRRSRAPHPATWQLCRQVEQVAVVVLASCEDPRLEDLCVFRVEPAPDAGHLLVILGGMPSVTPGEVTEALRGLVGHLRQEVATEIHRKRVPELTLRYLGA